ncbi:hypothetical protein NKH18_10460 [Streptomyces sp. M10(2022)]
MTDGIDRRVLPAFYEQLKAELTFPLAWEHNRSQAFPAWREAARAVAEDALLQPHDRRPVPFCPETVEEQEAGPYTRRTVEFALSRYGRVRGSLLLPHGTGPFPGAAPARPRVGVPHRQGESRTPLEPPRPPGPGTGMVRCLLRRPVRGR